MSHKKDMRRPDLIVPYVEPKKDSEPDMSGALASTLPMVSIITRNKLFGWTAVLFALQAWLIETPVQRKRSSTPAIFTVCMAVASAMMSYLPLFFPQMNPGGGTGTQPAAPQPPA